VTHVLVVEDDPLVLRVIVGMLSRDGFEVATCTSVDEALDALDGVDVVVTDLNLGGREDGRELARRLSGRLPVIVVSGSTELGAGVPEAAAVVAKPFRLAELLAALAPYH
jgi:CheY-like chemotaxis protein